jgi:hypothetical protein
MQMFILCTRIVGLQNPFFIGEQQQTLVPTILNVPQSMLLNLDDSRKLRSHNCSSMDHNGYLMEYDDRFQDPSSLVLS